MAVTTITPTRLVSDTGVVITPGAGTAINTSNSMVFAYPKDGELLITIDSNHASTVATVAAGYGINAQTDTYAVGDTIEHLIVIGASSKFKNSDGNISITWATNSAGFVTAWYLPTSNT